MRMIMTWLVVDGAWEGGWFGGDVGECVSTNDVSASPIPAASFPPRFFMISRGETSWKPEFEQLVYCMSGHQLERAAAVEGGDTFIYGLLPPPRVTTE